MHCQFCEGELYSLGTIGGTDHYRCRNCGADSSAEYDDSDDPRMQTYKERLDAAEYLTGDAYIAALQEIRDEMRDDIECEEFEDPYSAFDMIDTIAELLE